MSKDSPDSQNGFNLEKYVDNIHELLERFPDINELYIQALLLAKTFKRVLKMRANFKLSAEPEMERVPIVEFRKKMRVWSLEKFNNTTYISVINFYNTVEDKKNDNALGAIVLYIGEEYISYLLKRLGYPDIEEEPEEFEAASGTLLNLIAGSFKSGLVQLGYQEPVMSHFSTYRGEVPGGVLYDTTQTEKYEIALELAGAKVVMLDLTMGATPKKKSPYL